jgi:hypothetical protein
MRLNSIVLGCLLLSALAQATPLLDVQFGGTGPAYTGAAVDGTAGDYWNYLTEPGNISLDDTAGDPTGIVLTDSDSSFTSPFGGGFSSTPFAALMAGYLFNTFGNTMTITGLEPDATFNLYIYTQGDVASDGRAIEVNANGVIGDTAATDATASTFILGQNYLNLAVTADGSGDLTISYATLSGESDINGFQLDQTGSDTPEPATFALLVVGLAVVAGRKLRRLRGQL